MHAEVGRPFLNLHTGELALGSLWQFDVNIAIPNFNLLCLREAFLLSVDFALLR